MLSSPSGLFVISWFLISLIVCVIKKKKVKKEWRVSVSSLICIHIYIYIAKSILYIFVLGVTGLFANCCGGKEKHRLNKQKNKQNQQNKRAK